MDLFMDGQKLLQNGRYHINKDCTGKIPGKIPVEWMRAHKNVQL